MAVVIADFRSFFDLISSVPDLPFGVLGSGCLLHPLKDCTLVSCTYETDWLSFPRRARITLLGVCTIDFAFPGRLFTVLPLPFPVSTTAVLHVGLANCHHRYAFACVVTEVLRATKRCV